MRGNPPRLARALISILVPAGFSRDGVLGDMHEMYAERYEAKGWLSATWWYWWQAVRTPGQSARSTTTAA
jgi:hypothetical protein